MSSSDAPHSTRIPTILSTDISIYAPASGGRVSCSHRPMSLPNTPINPNGLRNGVMSKLRPWRNNRGLLQTYLLAMPRSSNSSAPLSEAPCRQLPEAVREAAKAPLLDPSKGTWERSNCRLRPSRTPVVQAMQNEERDERMCMTPSWKR